MSEGFQPKDFPIFIQRFCGPDNVFRSIHSRHERLRVRRGQIKVGIDRFRVEGDCLFKMANRLFIVCLL